MRMQTNFEKLIQNTNGQFFSLCFIGLRILLGLLSIYLSTLLPIIPGSELWDDTLWFDFVAPLILLTVGCFMVLGLMIRPSILLAMLVTVTFALNFIDLKSNPLIAIMMIGQILLLGLFGSGGAGHAFGLDGVVFSNIQRPGKVAKFLFG